MLGQHAVSLFARITINCVRALKCNREQVVHVEGVGFYMGVWEHSQILFLKLQVKDTSFLSITEDQLVRWHKRPVLMDSKTVLGPELR